MACAGGRVTPARHVNADLAASSRRQSHSPSFCRNTTTATNVKANKAASCTSYLQRFYRALQYPKVQFQENAIFVTHHLPLPLSPIPPTHAFPKNLRCRRRISRTSLEYIPNLQEAHRMRETSLRLFSDGFLEWWVFSLFTRRIAI